MDVAGRTIVVTGAGGGIGGAAAVGLARAGASVVLVDRDEAAAKQVLDQLDGEGHEVVSIDVSSPDNLVTLFGHMEADGRQIAGVVNSAGIVSGGGPWPTSDLHRMRTVIDVNAAGTVLLSTLAARQESAGDRVIVNVASAAALRPHAPDPAYATSKAGVLAFTRSAAAAGVDRLRVNAVLPGVVRTKMLDSTGTDGVAPWLAPRLDRPLLTAEQVASAIVELVVGDQDGECWSLELDQGDPDHVIRTPL